MLNEVAAHAMCDLMKKRIQDLITGMENLIVKEQKFMEPSEFTLGIYACLMKEAQEIAKQAVKEIKAQNPPAKKELLGFFVALPKTISKVLEEDQND